MNNQYKKLQNLRESNDAIFQELFGLGNKQQNQSSGSGQVEKVGEGKYRMGNSVITELKGAPEAVFLGYDFEKSPLKWLLDATFEGGIEINLSTTPHSLENFNGSWKSGVYKGKYFGPYSIFLGGQFGDESSEPLFLPEYVNWKANPHYFFSGKIKNSNEGVLGLRNLPFGKIQNSFNILSIAPGTMITIELNGGVKHMIKCISRLGSNRFFSYKVTNGKTKKEYEVTHEWSEIRGNSAVDFLKNTNINLQSSNKSIGIFGLDISEGIVSVSVSSPGTSGQVGSSFKPEETPADLSKKQVSYELANLPFLGIEKIPRKGGSETSLYFNFPNTSIQDEFNNITGLLKQGWINSYIKQIKTAKDYGILSGAPVNYNFLATLIGKDPSVDVKNLDKDTVNALNGLESFLKSFVNTMVRRVRKTGAEKGLYDVEDTIGKEMIKNQIKSLIGAKKTTGSKTGGAARKIKFAESSDVRSIIKDILSENLKHF